MLCVLLTYGTAAAQNLSAALAMTETAVRSGQLPNGLRFYIRQNARPEKRVSLRLAVKAGSIDEADDQRGLAHMLEHMAFNGTTHFKPGELVAYLESIGSRFGPHLNAYTSYDETVYMIDVPTDREGVVPRGFEALSDFAGGMTLDPKEIDRERGVVIEEWRGRQGSGARIQAIQEPALYGQSKYAQRLPIGLPETLRTFSPQRLRDFYRTHYRPERMGVIVVGDIDPTTAERLVRQYFGALAASGRATARPVYPIPAHTETRYAVAVDKEAQGSSVTVIQKRAREALRTVGDYRQALLRGLVHQMLNARLAELARATDAPFLGASTGEGSLGQTVDAFTMSARVNDGGIETGLTALVRELKRAREFGFGQGELDRVKKELLASYDRSFAERDKAESDGFVQELLNVFLRAEPAPGIDAEVALARQLVPTITLGDASALVRTLVPETNRVVLTVAPEKTGLTPSTPQSLRTAFSAGASANVTAWKDELSDRALLAKAPVPGTVRARRQIAEVGVTVLTLSNGAEVWLKPTTFKNDQVVFTGYAKGGTSLAAEPDYRDASLATALVGQSGLGGFTPVDLSKLLAGKTASAAPFIGSATHGVSGSAAPADLETALQLLYLDFTAADHTREGFELLKRRMKAQLANQAQNPNAVYGERVRAINTLDHYTSKPLRVEDVDALNPDRMFAYYQARFANAADFTFFFVGAFTVEQITPLINTYIGSLPSTGVARGAFGDLRLQFPSSVVKERVSKGQDPKSQTLLSFFADTGLNELEIHRANAAADVLEMRLRDILREELGGTYSVGVGYSNTQPLPGYGTMAVQFGSAPENVDKLVAAVLAEVQRLQKEGPSADDIQKVKETQKRDIETALQQNGYWLNSLQTLHLYGWDPVRITKRLERAESLTVDNVHEMFKKYFPLDRYTLVTLVPESR